MRDSKISYGTGDHPTTPTDYKRECDQARSDLTALQGQVEAVEEYCEVRLGSEFVRGANYTARDALAAVLALLNQDTEGEG